MLCNNIDINKRTEKAATLFISAPILKVRAWGNGCQVAICSRLIEFDCFAQLPTSLTQQLNSDDVGNGQWQQQQGGVQQRGQ
jgi:hypothetical protein